MTDRSVSIGSVVANMLWVGVVALIASAWHLDDNYLGQAGLAMSAAAATATIRSYFVRQNQIMRNLGDLRAEGGVRGVR